MRSLVDSRPSRTLRFCCCRLCNNQVVGADLRRVIMHCPCRFLVEQRLNGDLHPALHLRQARSLTVHEYAAVWVGEKDFMMLWNAFLHT